MSFSVLISYNYCVYLMKAVAYVPNPSLLSGTEILGPLAFFAATVGFVGL